MLRKLLTLVAIVSGLTAMAAPAHARVGTLAEAQVQLAGESVVQCRVVASEALQADKERAPRKGDTLRCTIRKTAVTVPTVQLSADRALE